MKITRLYSNKPEIFQPIEFNQGLSAVVAEIHAPDVRDIDTHNLAHRIRGCRWGLNPPASSSDLAM